MTTTQPLPAKMSALTPKPLSEVLRHHAALCVKPIFWIPPLLDILGCRFQQVEDETANPIDDEPAEPAKPAKRAKRRLMSDEEVAQLTPCKLAVLNLAAPGIHVAKHGGINNLFYYDEQGRFEECGTRANFFFANRHVHRSECSIFAPNDRTGPRSRLLVGYFHYSYVEKARRRKLEAPWPPLGFRGYRNRPVERINRKKLSKVTPDEWSRDPYLVCLLLSLAQRQARSLASPRQTTYLSRLLVTTTKKPDLYRFIFLYEAEITSQLLDSLDNPTCATERTAWPTIKLKRIPFRPFDTFQERLIAELMAPNPLGHNEALPIRGGKKE